MCNTEWVYLSYSEISFLYFKELNIQKNGARSFNKALVTLEVSRDLFQLEHNDIKVARTTIDIVDFRRFDIYSLNLSNRIINWSYYSHHHYFFNSVRLAYALLCFVNNLCNLTSFSASYNVEVDLVVLQSLHRKWGNSSIHYPRDIDIELTFLYINSR